MCSDLDKVSFLMSSSMPNSDEMFLVKDSKEEVGFEILERPVLEFQEECQVSASAVQDLDHGLGQHQDQRHEEGAKDHESNEKEQEYCKAQDSQDSSAETKSAPAAFLGRVMKETTDGVDDDDDDDGFKTPTSSEHKIPAIPQCPPAPRKPRPSPSAKRKASSSTSTSSPNARRSLYLDLSQEVESLFPRSILADFHKKIKKARSDDHQDT